MNIRGIYASAITDSGRAFSPPMCWLITIAITCDAPTWLDRAESAPFCVAGNSQYSLELSTSSWWPCVPLAHRIPTHDNMRINSMCATERASNSHHKLQRSQCFCRCKPNFVCEKDYNQPLRQTTPNLTRHACGCTALGARHRVHGIYTPGSVPGA